MGVVRGVNVKIDTNLDVGPFQDPRKNFSCRTCPACDGIRRVLVGVSLRQTLLHFLCVVDLLVRNPSREDGTSTRDGVDRKKVVENRKGVPA